jgi:hypothetical protein
VKYNMRKRVGGGVVNFEAVKFLKFHCASAGPDGQPEPESQMASAGPGRPRRRVDDPTEAAGPPPSPTSMEDLAMRDQMNNIHLVPAIAPAAVTDNTAFVSAIIDRQGYDA